MPDEKVEPELTAPANQGAGQTYEVGLRPVDTPQSSAPALTQNERLMDEMLRNGNQEGAERLARRLWHTRSD